MSFQEDAEARDHQRQLVENEADRQKGVWGQAPLGPEEYPYKPLYISMTTDESGQERWFVEDARADWISEAFDNYDLAADELARLERTE